MRNLRETGLNSLEGDEGDEFEEQTRSILDLGT